MIFQANTTKLFTFCMNKVLTQIAFCVLTGVMEINYISFIVFLAFLFVSHHTFYYCGLKKLNSISDSLLCFSYLCLSLSQTIYKGTTWRPMKLVCSDFALFSSPSSHPPISFHFLICVIFYCRLPLDLVFCFMFCDLRDCERIVKNENWEIRVLF